MMKTKTATAKVARQKAKNDSNKHIGLVRKDIYLKPYEDAIRGRHEYALWKENKLTDNGKKRISDVSNGYDYYGLHKTSRGWVFREWAPNAVEIYLIGDFNDWKETPEYRAKRIEGTGNWELKLTNKALKHGDLYKMRVHWNGGEGERIPA